ncbi:hypothetical protein PAHAL_2G438100 [Panicum hallii]|uniref:Uncharacterized protein n=1 Tax=Panicum hallii TaxID=206008 RepID=A0A2T8KSQ4_9POAL|nr:hypothetical protein PAHAL_2G438100 [Panicum hallii]
MAEIALLLSRMSLSPCLTHLSLSLSLTHVSLPASRISPSLTRISPSLFLYLFPSLAAQQIPISSLLLIQQGRRRPHPLHGQWSTWPPLAPWAADLGIHDLKDELRRLWAGWSHGARAIGGGAANRLTDGGGGAMELAHGGGAAMGLAHG